MNSIYKNFKTQLLLAVVLLGASMGFAQNATVKVPVGCTVVVAGAGGTVGPGTATPGGPAVGQGGTITMNDGTTPNGGTFTFTGPAGITLGPVISWALSGDLSAATTAPNNYGSPVQPGNGVSATIISYNKTLRPTEGVAPSNASWARSKGRVTVGYTTNLTLCPGVFIGGNVSFEVFKRFTALPVTNVPVIVGPDCVDAGKQCTFSVDQIVSDNANDNIGFDKYYWSGIPAIAIKSATYYSADNSSVTFTPANSTSFTLKCCMGRANPFDGGVNLIQIGTGTTCVTKTVGAAPTEPTYTTTNGAIVVSTILANAPCVPTGTVAAPGTFTIEYTSANTCTWSAANTGWDIGIPVTVTTIPPTKRVTIDTKGFNNPGILTLAVTNGTCTPLTFQYQINRSFVATAVAIVPPTVGLNCVEANSASEFTISTAAAANTTSWTIAPTGAGVTLSTGTPSSTVRVNVGANPTTQEYTLTARATSCPGDIIYKFRVKPLVPTITGTACVVKGALTQQTYTCAATTGASYVWQFPAGWNAVNFTTTTNQIAVTPANINAVLNGNITVTSKGITGCENSATFAINYSSVAPTNVVAGCFSVGIAGTGSVTYSNPAGVGSYYGTLTASGSTVHSITGSAVSLIIAGVSTNVGVLLDASVAGTLSFNTSALIAGTYSLKIYHNSGCGDAVFSTTNVTVTGNNAALSPNLGVTQDNYFAIPPSTMVSPQYQWTSCTAGGICTPVGGNSPLLQLTGAPPPAGNQICVNVFPLGATCITRLCTAQGTHSRMGNPNTVIKGEIIEGITIFPNPNSGNFNIKIVDFKKEATATLYDSNGKKIKEFNLTKGENKIENEELSKGNYYVAVTVDDKTDVKQIIIK